jgi:RNA polymerase sigma-70 factor (ECF subfamily)
MALTTSAQQILKSSSGDLGQLPEKYWELVELYRAELLNQAFAVVGNQADAEDVVQETLCEALQNEEKLANARSLGAWLRSINRANALDCVRNRRSESKRMIKQDREAPAQNWTTGGFSAVGLREVVASAIETLPENLRTVVVLHYWEHLPCDAIAARLRQPLGTIHWLLAEAAIRLHGKLKICMEQASGEKK